MQVFVPTRMRRGHMAPRIRPPLIRAVATVTTTTRPVTTIRVIRARPIWPSRRSVGRAAPPSVVSIPFTAAPPVMQWSAPPSQIITGVPAVPAREILWVRTNYLPNSGTETNTIGWNDFVGATASRNIVQSHSGDSSLEIVSTFASQGAPEIQSDLIPAVARERWSLSGWVRGDQADRAYMYLTQFDAALNNLGFFGAPLNLTGGVFERYTAQYGPLLEGTAFVRVSLVFAMQSGGFVPQNQPLGQWDDLQLERGPVVTSLIPTDGGIASGVIPVITMVAPPARVNWVAPPPSANLDLVAVAVPAASTFTAPVPAAASVFPIPAAVAQYSAPLSRVIAISAIPRVVPASLLFSMPIPCLERTLASNIVSPGVLDLAPLLPADTC